MKKYLLLSAALLVTPLMAQDLIVEEIPLEAPAPTEITSTSPDTEITPVSHGDGTLDDLYTLVEEHKKAVRDLTERLEQTEFKLKQTEEKLERTTQDLAFRVAELEQNQLSLSTRHPIKTVMNMLTAFYKKMITKALKNNF